MQLDAPVAGEKLPTEQATHDNDADAPVMSDAVPTTQAIHDVDTMLAEYIPAAQGVHETAPRDAYMPAAQDAQTNIPALFWYIPAAQGTHPLSELKNVPAAQELEQEVDAGAEYVPSEQLEQLDAPRLEAYLFASQFVHVLAPKVE